MNVEYMSSEDDMDLGALIIKIGYGKRGKYFKDIPKYLNKIYDNWGYQTHNDVISILELDKAEYPRRAPSYEYYWNNDAYNDPEVPHDYKELVHKVFCLRVVGGAENHDEMVGHFRIIIEKYGYDAYADAIRILGFEEDCWLDEERQSVEVDSTDMESYNECLT
jgi:hypothetical protein